MFSITSILFLLAGGVFVSFSLIMRWILVHWYLAMDEWGWFFWGGNIPYIETEEGVEEFVKYSSDRLFFLGLAHLLVGTILTPFPDFWLLLPVWFFVIVIVGLALRADLIDKAFEVRQKYAPPPKPNKVCPKCGKGMWLNFKTCPNCEEPLPD